MIKHLTINLNNQVEWTEKKTSNKLISLWELKQSQEKRLKKLRNWAYPDFVGLLKFKNLKNMKFLTD